MTPKDYELMKDLCFYKRAALKAGYKNEDYELFAKANISKTEFNSGHVAEIAMAYLLGRVQRIVNFYFRINIKLEDDIYGSDFVLVRQLENGRYKSSKIQQKFAKHNYNYYPDDVIVLEFGADKSFQGLTELAPERGNDVLYRFLIGSKLFDEETIYDIFDADPSLEDDAKKVWASIRG